MRGAKKGKVKNWCEMRMRISSRRLNYPHMTFHEDSRVGKQQEKVSKSKPAEPKETSLGCPKGCGPSPDISGPLLAVKFGPRTP